VFDFHSPGLKLKLTGQIDHKLGFLFMILHLAFELFDSGSQLIKPRTVPIIDVNFSRFYFYLRFITLVPISLVAVSRVPA
jgi:hypothetical protein